MHRVAVSIQTTRTIGLAAAGAPAVAAWSTSSLVMAARGESASMA